MHFKLFYDYLLIRTLKQEDIQVYFYSVGTTLIYAFYVFFLQYFSTDLIYR